MTTTTRELVSARQVAAANALLKLSQITGEPVEQSIREVAAAQPVDESDEDLRALLRDHNVGRERRSVDLTEATELATAYVAHHEHETERPDES
jgi:hypothetical protein